MQKIAQGLTDFFGQFTRRYAPAIITLIIIAGAFFFYSNVIMGRNEQTIKERSFRGLNRIAGNVKQKIDNYSKYNSRNFLRQINLDSSTRRSQYNKILTIREEYGLAEDSSGTADKDTFSLKFDREWEIVFNNPPVKKDKNWVFQKAVAPVSEFITPLLRRDLFDYYFIAYKDSVLYDELNLSNNKYTVPQGGIAVTDSTIKGEVIQFGFINEVEVGGKRYKLFLAPFMASSNSSFVLGGYMPLEKYEDEKKYIPGNAILWLILALVIVILMFPLLKIFLMNKVEQLMSRNVLTSLMSVHLLGSIIIILLLNVYAYFMLIRGKTDDDLKSLADNIQKTFNAELNDAINEIDSSEKELVDIVKNNPQTFSGDYLPDMYLPSRDSPLVYRVAANSTKQDGKGEMAIRPAFIGKKYKYFENISWVDSSGQHLVRWTNNPVLQNKANVRKRDYFQATLNKSLLLTDSGKEYYLTGVSSWTAQKKLVVIARPSQLKSFIDDTSGINKGAVIRGTIADTLKKAVVVSLSSPFRSLFNPILPYGFGFCIIDERGNVFFHYDEKRSLNENLLEECSDDNGLSSLLNTGSSGIFNAHYTGSNHRFYIQPVQGMPYNIVTYYDIENIWNQDLDVMSATAVIVLFNMGFILVLVLVTRMFSLKRLSNQILFIWIEPKPARRDAYIQATLGFLAASVIQLLFSLLSSAADDLYMVGIPFGFTHILVAYSFYIYKSSDNRDPKTRKISSDFRKPLWVLCALYLVAGPIFVSQLNSGQVEYIISQVSLISLLVIIVLWKRGWKKAAIPFEKKSKEEQEKANCDYKTKYQLSLYAFILATGVIPALVYFTLSFKEEQRLAVRYQQMDFVNNFLQKKPFVYYKGDSVWNLSYQFPFHYKSFADKIDIENIPKMDSPKLATMFGKLYAKLKPSFSTYAKRIEYLNTDLESPGSFMWEDTRSTDSLRLWFNVLKTNNIAGNKRLIATKKFENGFIMICREFGKHPVYHILLLFAGFVLLAGLYVILTFLIPEIFVFDKAVAMSLQDIGKRFLGNIPRVNHIYLIGIINSGKHRKIRETFKSDYEIFDFDIASIVSKKPDVPKKPDAPPGDVPKTKWEEILEDLDNYTSGKILPDPKNPGAKVKGRLILIRHFEMQMNDIEVTEKKLEMLETLLSFSAARKLNNGDPDKKDDAPDTIKDKRSIKIIISSARHYDSMPLTFKSDDNKTVKDFSDRWTNVMNNFCTFYHAWQEEEAEKPQQPVIKNPEPAKSHKVIKERCIDEVMKLVNNECSHSVYLYDLREPLQQFLREEIEKLPPINNLKNLRESKIQAIINERENEVFDSLCVKLQSIAHHYYLSLWLSLTGDEQRTLYDIASDGLMNQRNKDQAENLYGLGLITNNTNGPGYRLMNESFRLFVLTRLGKKEIDKLRSDADPSHSFNRIQLPTLMVIISLGVFLFVTQKEAFNNLVTYVGAAAAGIAALLKVLDSFSAPKPAGG